MIAKVILYLLWLILGLYVGIGGYVALDIEKRKAEAKISANLKMSEEKSAIVDQIDFKTEELARIYMDEKKSKKYFGFIFKSLPKNMIYLFTAMSFGILGVISRVTKNLSIDGLELRSKDVEVFFSPILGLMTGIIMLAISRIIPNILVGNSGEIEPLTLAFLSLIAGFCSKQFYNWLVSSGGKIFKN
ncbi:MAG: hypothetical protein AAGC45_06180 [Bacteroidota bacterium]